MRPFTIISLCLATALGGCSSDSPTSSQRETAAELAARLKTDAVSCEWSLLGFGGEDSVAVRQDSRITLKLEEDGTLGGSAGCNTYFGRWEMTDPDAVSITDLGATEMACVSEGGVAEGGVMEQESRYLQALARITTMQMADADLLLTFDTGDRWLHFTAADSGCTGGGESVDIDEVTKTDSIVIDDKDSTVVLDAASLLGPIWRLRFIETVQSTGDHADRYVDALPADVRITAQFGDDGRMYGKAGCNQYFVSYEVPRNGRLELGLVGLTKMFCRVPSLMVWESRYVDLLGELHSYQIVGERLILSHDAGSLHFEVAGADSSEPPDTTAAGEQEWPQASLRLTSTDDGDHIELPQPGQLLEVALPAQPSTGYRWLVAAPDSTALLLVAERFDADDDGLVGGGGIQRLVFEAQAPGRTTLRLLYMRPWESVPAADSFEVGLTINGGIVPPPIEPLDIRLGSSFGECMGYCWQEMILDAESMTLVSRGWDLETYPEKVLQQKMDRALWDRLLQLADLNDLARMEEVYGCPDCADGGAEWITMSLAGRQETVKMEFGAQLEPIAGLLKLLREVRSELAEKAD